jgi:hypothetical protein
MIAVLDGLFYLHFGRPAPPTPDGSGARRPTKPQRRVGNQDRTVIGLTTTTECGSKHAVEFSLYHKFAPENARQIT